VDWPQLAQDRFEDICDVKAVKIPGSEKAGNFSTNWSEREALAVTENHGVR